MHSNHGDSTNNHVTIRVALRLSAPQICLGGKPDKEVHRCTNDKTHSHHLPKMGYTNLVGPVRKLVTMGSWDSQNKIGE